ncbi:hypothetical protein H0H93_002571 [Arthromyces matolae]|nr:hypothetical protein H0H93_002571 [Arthromyces matolae]
MLSIDSQTILKALLPPTAFVGFKKVLGAEHPSRADNDAMVVDVPTNDDDVDPSVFTDAHFLAAAHTLQDHIYSGWMTDAHAQKIVKYEESIRNGSLAAAWKDEEWERNNPPPPALPNNTTSSAERAGDAAEIKLPTLAQAGVLQVGDILVFRRNFSALNTVIEKDAIIRSIHPKTHTLTVLLEPGTSKYLPSHLVSPQPSAPTGSTQEAAITSPTQLESVLLDNDGRVERGKRPNGNAWKCITVWRWRNAASRQDSGDGRLSLGLMVAPPFRCRISAEYIFLGKGAGATTRSHTDAG